jgi:hypothetical protein
MTTDFNSNMRDNAQRGTRTYLKRYKVPGVHIRSIDSEYVSLNSSTMCYASDVEETLNKLQVRIGTIREKLLDISKELQALEEAIGAP